MRKIGIMGGTFDPVHLGHLIIAEAALDAAGLDEVRFVPCGRPYFKDERCDKVSDAEDRLEMCRLAVNDNPRFTVSDIEVKRRGKTYTYETMEELKAGEPDSEFSFICGADSVVSMSRWYLPERIFRACSILAAVRDDETDRKCFDTEIKKLHHEFGADISLLPVPNIRISSTDIRERIKSGKSVRYLTMTNVMEYIERKGLYR